MLACRGPKVEGRERVHNVDEIVTGCCRALEAENWTPRPPRPLTMRHAYTGNDRRLGGSSPASWSRLALWRVDLRALDTNVAAVRQPPPLAGMYAAATVHSAEAAAHPAAVHHAEVATGVHHVEAAAAEAPGEAVTVEIPVAVEVVSVEMAMVDEERKAQNGPPKKNGEP